MDAGCGFCEKPGAKTRTFTLDLSSADATSGSGDPASCDAGVEGADVFFWICLVDIYKHLHNSNYVQFYNI
jgi:hypothetical protein